MRRKRWHPHLIDEDVAYTFCGRFNGWGVTAYLNGLQGDTFGICGTCRRVRDARIAARDKAFRESLGTS